MAVVRMAVVRMAESGRRCEPGGGPVPRGRAGVAGLVRPRTPATTGTPCSAAQPLADLLDRLVDRGVVISGDVVIALAGVDLIRLDLRLLLVGIQTAVEGAGEVAE